MFRESARIISTLEQLNAAGLADIRLVLVDDGSSDDTVAVATKCIERLAIADASVVALPRNVGKGGAVRQFTQWLCATNTAAHTTNLVTGVNYRTEIVSALNAEGFQQLSSGVAGLRTAGYSCAVATE